MSKVRRLASLATVMAFVLSLGVQCLAATETTTAQMACCADMNHDCGAAAADEDCCQSERVEQAQLLQQAPPVALPVATLTSATVTLVRPPDAHSRVEPDASLTASPPPKYVLLATFLI